MLLIAQSVPGKAMMRPGKFGSVEAFGVLGTSVCLPPQPTASKTWRTLEARSSKENGLLIILIPRSRRP
jgi:hypothetical protein